MNPSHIEIIASALFGIAIIHTFSASFFEKLSYKHPKHAGLFHLLGEVEVVFGFLGPSTSNHPRTDAKHLGGCPFC